MRAGAEAGAAPYRKRRPARLRGSGSGARRWLVLMGCFIGMAVAMPAILLIPMGLFLKPVTAEFGWSRMQFSSIVSAASLFNAVSMPAAGWLVDRFGVRRVVAAGTLLGCGACAALSIAHSYAGFVGIVALAVTTGNLASYPAYMSLAHRWFDRHLGLALAVTSTGLAIGVGGSSYLIARRIAQHGWRSAFLTVGVVALTIGLINLALLVQDNHGPAPEAERVDRDGGAEGGDLSLAAALRTRDFWLYAASFALVTFAVVGCNVHLPALLSDRGGSAGLIAAAVAIGSAGSLAGRLFTGMLLDRLSVLVVAGTFFVGQPIGFLLLLHGLAWVLPASFLLGAVQGAEIDVMGFVVARRFGRVAYAQIYGTCFAVTLTGAFLGPIALAALFDRTGSYGLGLSLLAPVPLLALGLLWRATILAGEAVSAAP